MINKDAVPEQGGLLSMGATAEEAGREIADGIAGGIKPEGVEEMRAAVAEMADAIQGVTDVTRALGDAWAEFVPPFIALVRDVVLTLWRWELVEYLVEHHVPVRVAWFVAHHLPGRFVMWLAGRLIALDEDEEEDGGGGDGSANQREGDAQCGLRAGAVCGEGGGSMTRSSLRGNLFAVLLYLVAIGGCLYIAFAPWSLPRKENPDAADLTAGGTEQDLLTFDTSLAHNLDLQVRCEQLLDIDIFHQGAITVTWQDGLDGCTKMEGLEILIGGEIYYGWRCSTPEGIHLDWRNSQRDDCDGPAVIFER